MFLGLYLRIKRIKYRHIIPDAVIVLFSLYASLLLRLSGEHLAYYLPILNQYIPLFLVLRIGILLGSGVYDIVWRYVSLQDFFKIVKAVLLSTVTIIAATYLVDVNRVPRSTFLIDTLLVTALLCAIRVIRRWHHEHSTTRLLRHSGKRALIYGAGNNGRTLAQRITTDKELLLQLVGFIDDDHQKVGRYIAGVKVLGARIDLPTILRRYRIQELIISSKDIRGPILRELLQIAHSFNIRPRMFSEMTSQGKKGRFELCRSIELADLLNRPQSHVDFNSIRRLVHRKRVLITGAGGSIGSELARQIFRFGPSRLMLLDHSEYNLYQIDQELRGSAQPENIIVPLLLDLKDSGLLFRIVSEHGPEIIFHAAAYKHVHLVEDNPYSSILNNILGTKNLVDLAEFLNVQALVLISSDKAVNPAGVMGATKRICELMVTESGLKTGRRYCSVRFGNVLGSSGSLIPLLQRQIESGGPLTLTDPEATRYFMVIPEAVSLVLKAVTIAKPGDIHMLQMGEPVKIVEIAKSLITLMKQDEEIPVIFTGLRPGEKLHEELSLCGRELSTEHPNIYMLPRGDGVVKISDLEVNYLKKRVEKILTLAEEADHRCLSEMRLLASTSVTGYDAVPSLAFNSGTISSLASVSSLLEH